MINRIKEWAKSLKRQIFILYLAYKDNRTAWYAKLFAATVVAYAFSPIDLVPDFIPILGYIDDVILVPLGIMLAMKMIPSQVIEECRLKTEVLMKNGKPKNWVAAGVIIFVWILACSWFILLTYHYLS